MLYIYIYGSKIVPPKKNGAKYKTLWFGSRLEMTHFGSPCLTIFDSYLLSYWHRPSNDRPLVGPRRTGTFGVVDTWVGQGAQPPGDTLCMENGDL